MATSIRSELSARATRARARTRADINIGYANEEDDDFPAEIAPDDIAAANEEQDEDEEINTVSDSLSSDDDEELDASILEVISEEGSSDEEEEDVQLATPGLQASSGLQWILQTDQAHPPGRLAAQNIFRVANVGLAVGFHPNSSLEAFKEISETV